MKTLFAVAALLVFAMPTLPQAEDGFRVEKLTPQEIRDLRTANATFQAAVSAHNAALQKIRVAHGAAKWPDEIVIMNHSSASSLMHCGDSVSVELRGDYALITTKPPTCVNW